jgi:hypothetical protein
MTTLRSIKSISRSPSRLALLLISLVLACFTLPDTAHAVSPAPDGGYPNGNTAKGQNALHSLTSGGYNTAIGFLSLFSDTQSSFNTAIGAGTLLANTGDDNTATGAAALLNNTTGFNNTANGSHALLSNTTGVDNTATGHAALVYNTTGAHNVANGDAALALNTTGNDNTAIGYETLFYNTGNSNTANGYQTLFYNSTGAENTANGYQALYSNTTGTLNVANGYQALYHNTTGDYNTAIGDLALSNVTTGSGNFALGTQAGQAVTTADGVTCIGSLVFGENADDPTWIGHVYGVTTTQAQTAPVIVSVSGQLGVAASSQRFKKDIATMEKASETILSLRPVTFHYKSDVKDFPQFGLIAEEVAKVNPALVLPDKEGKPFTVRYDAVNAMLLNEFLKEHRKNEEQQATITELKSTVAQQQKDFQATVTQLTARLDEQTAQILKVSAQFAAASPSGGRLEASKPAPQVALNNP